MKNSSRLILALALLAACKPTAAPPAPSGPVGGMELRMGNCPSAVPGATTGLTTVVGGVALDVTAEDLAASREIVARANRHSGAGEPDPNVAPHSGAHGGPGTTGHCPVVHTGTTVTVMEIGGGVRITVLADDPTQAAALEQETRARLNWLDPAARTP